MLCERRLVRASSLILRQLALPPAAAPSAPASGDTLSLSPSPDAPADPLLRTYWVGFVLRCERVPSADAAGSLLRHAHLYFAHA
eukprot:1368796-Rhodomonas_salina.2